jgi:hypothetical protein
MGKCELGECPQSKTLKDICCLDCNELEMCLEKGYTCLQSLRSKDVRCCDEYIGNEVQK